MAQHAESFTRERAPVVLLVDDSADSRLMYGIYLRDAGYLVETAADGNEALAVTLSVRPDVVVMDLRMPGLDGWEAMRLLRSYDRTRHIPIVVCSAATEPENMARASDAGCTLFVQKPCLPEDLEKTIRAALDSAKETQKGAV